MRQRSTTAGHKRTRRDHADEIAEDYVEAIDEFARTAGECRVMDLAGRFGVSHVSVVQTVGRLVREGYATTAPRRPVELTAKGKRLAAACRERHDVVFRFLLAIGVDEKTAAIDSEGIEHHVSKATLARFRAIAAGEGVIGRERRASEERPPEEWPSGANDERSTGLRDTRG